MRSRSATILLILLFHQAFSQTLRVGVYHNPPLSIIDSTEQYKGYTVDLLSAIAADKGWELQFSKCGFSEGLRLLQSGEIDILPALAYSATRDSIFLLNKTNVVTNWGEIYKHEENDIRISSIDDLRNHEIAVLRDDHYYRNGKDGLFDLAEAFDLDIKIVEVASYDDVIQYIEEHPSTLGLVSRYYGAFNTSDRQVLKTSVNLGYVSVRYGIHRHEENIAILNALDDEMQALIENRNSVYYSLERQYFYAGSDRFIPSWLWQIFITVAGGLVTLAVFTILLQYQVKKKTSELKQTNRDLARSESEARLAAQTIEASQDIGFWFLPGQAFTRINNSASTRTGYAEEELLTMFPRDLLASDKNDKYYESIRDGSWSGHLLLEDEFRRKDGTTFPVELSLDEFDLDGKKYVCGFARDISARVKAEFELLEKNKELSCLYAINQLTANREYSIEEVFERAVKVIPLAWQYPTSTSVRIQWGGKNFQSEGYNETPWKLEAPLVLGSEKVGLLSVGYVKQDKAGLEQFLSEENNLILAIAKELSDMLLARDADRQIMATILSTEDKERSRISKELHDSVGQTLSAISLHLKSMLGRDALLKEDRQRLVEIEELVNNAIDESRSVSHNLMPPALTDLGFIYAVQNILESVQEVSGISFDFHYNESDKTTPKEIDFTLFRIVQEAVNNAMKHAKASAVTIQYLVYDDQISLSVEDDGQGFDKEKVEKNHNFGLNSMRNRVMSIGGTISIDSSPGRGTGIHVNIPLKKNAHENITG